MARVNERDKFFAKETFWDFVLVEIILSRKVLLLRTFD